jgi:hypothetical protein
MNTSARSGKDQAGDEQFARPPSDLALANERFSRRRESVAFECESSGGFHVVARVASARARAVAPAVILNI